MAGSSLKWDEICDEQKRRIRICKLKQCSDSDENVERLETAFDQQISASNMGMDKSVCEIGSFEALVAEYKSEGGLDPRRDGSSRVVSGSESRTRDTRRPKPNETKAKTKRRNRCRHR